MSFGRVCGDATVGKPCAPALPQVPSPLRALSQQHDVPGGPHQQTLVSPVRLWHLKSRETFLTLKVHCHLLPLGRRTRGLRPPWRPSRVTQRVRDRASSLSLSSHFRGSLGWNSWWRCETDLYAIFVFQMFWMKYQACVFYFTTEHLKTDWTRCWLSFKPKECYRGPS